MKNFAAILAAGLLYGSCSGNHSNSDTNDLEIDDVLAQEAFNRGFNYITHTNIPLGLQFLYSFEGVPDKDVRSGFLLDYTREFALDLQGRKKFAVAGPAPSKDPELVQLASSNYLLLSAGETVITLQKSDDKSCRASFNVALFDSTETQVGEIAADVKYAHASNEACEASVVEESGKQTFANTIKGSAVAKLSICQGKFANVCNLVVKKSLNVLGDLKVDSVSIKITGGTSSADSAGSSTGLSDSSTTGSSDSSTTGSSDSSTTGSSDSSTTGSSDSSTTGSSDSSTTGSSETSPYIP